MTKSEILNALFEKYDLFFDPKDPNSKDNDVYVHKHYKIITRTGIEKIQKAAGIDIHYSVVDSGKDFFYVKGTGTLGDTTIETFASSSDETTTNGYYPEMAEKRCMSRLVLKLAGLYEYGVYGQDESETFEREEGTKTAQYRGN